LLDDDTDLVGKLRKGDSSAYHRLVDQYANRLYGLAYVLVGNREDAEEVVQETLAGVFRGIGSFQQRSSFWTWLARIVARQSAKVRQKYSTRNRVLHLPVDELAESKQPPPTTRSMTQAVDAKVDLATALDLLSREHREIIVLRELKQMSYTEISQVLDVPLGTVESRLSRARAELRKLLADWDD
jgi:RNA polymerase sigma-70 factor, ECF subfamily